MDIKNVSKEIRKFLKKNSPSILVGVGISGMIASSIFAIKATPKAIVLIDEKKKELDTDKLKAKDLIKTTWKIYLPYALTTVASASCIIFASSISSKRNAALATAYSLSETALMDYKDSIRKHIPDKVKEIEDDVAKKELERKPLDDSTEVIVLNEDGDLCCEPVSGRYFKTTINKIDHAVNAINHQLNTDDYASLNDFYYELGLKSTEIGNQLGWNVSDGLLEVSFSYDRDPNDHPCIVLVYRKTPKPAFDMVN